MNGEITQLWGVAAFLRRTASVEVVRHFSRSALYLSELRDHPGRADQYGVQPLTPAKSGMTNDRTIGRISRWYREAYRLHQVGSRSREG